MPTQRRASKQMGEWKGFTLWMTGLSGAGKSTISDVIVAEFDRRGVPVEVLDGDVVRENLSKGLGFSKEDRDTNIRRIAFVADLLSEDGTPEESAQQILDFLEERGLIPPAAS